jgi:hypothetical protein
LTIVGPGYFSYLSDLYSDSQTGQEFTSFDHFIPETTDRSSIGNYTLGFGTSIELDVKGGSNFW